MITDNPAKRTILLVEDHQDIAEMIFAYLEKRGFELDYAPDGE